MTAVYALRRQRQSRPLVSLCVGVGQGVALIGSVIAGRQQSLRIVATILDTDVCFLALTYESVSSKHYAALRAETKQPGPFADPAAD